MERIGMYRLERLIGEGAMGEVWLARHDLLEDVRAVKVLSCPLSDEAAFTARFIEGGRNLAMLKHPNIVPVYDMNYEGRLHYFVFEFVTPEGTDSQSLDDLIQSHLPNPLPPDLVYDIVRQICAGLSHAHSHGVVHRDLKPQNILFAPDGVVKISDFGIPLMMGAEFVRAAHEAATTGTAAHIGGSLLVPQTDDTQPRDAGRGATHSFVSTGHYMPPEALRTGEWWGPTGDVYSIGVLAYFMLTGERPMGMAAAPSEINSDIPAFWDAVLSHSMQRMPDRRYASIDEFWQALHAGQENVPVQIPVPKPDAKTTQPTPTRQPEPIPQPAPFLEEEAQPNDSRVPAGNGTGAHPYAIRTVEHLEWLAQETLARRTEGRLYRLENDLDATATRTANNGEGFCPIGYHNSATDFVAFDGDFDGNGMTVRHLCINRPDRDSVGLFGRIGDLGSVRNLTLAAADVTGHDSVGAVIGTNFGKLSDVTVEESIVRGNDRVGALAGSVEIGSGIRQCKANAHVHGNEAVGVLVGYTGTFSSIAESQASGHAEGISHVGGLVGGNYSPFTDCVSSADVIGQTCVGGLVGFCGMFAAIAQSTATGNVTGVEHVGGIAGNNQAPVTGSRAEGAVVGQTAVGGLLGTGMSGGEVLTCTATGNVNGDTCVGGLIGENFGSVSASTAEGNVNGKETTGGLIGRCVKAPVNNCNASGTVSANTLVGGLIGHCTDGTTVTGCNASGTIEAGDIVGGLIGQNESAVIRCGATSTVAAKNIVGGLVGLSTGEESKITACHCGNTIAALTCVGGVVGECRGGTVTDCGYEGQLAATENVGGIIGKCSANTTVSNIRMVRASVQGHLCVGSIAGYAEQTVLTECRVETSVRGKNCTGGVVGQCGESCSLKDCTVSGAVHGEVHVGGLVGMMGAKGRVSACESDCLVNGTERIGGLMGESRANVTECKATGNVSGTRMIGGLIGAAARGSQTLRCQTSGVITGADLIGGVIGECRGMLSLCNAAGDVSGKRIVGGVAGMTDDQCECYSSASTGRINGEQRAGGLIGENHGLVSDCNATGDVQGQRAIGGLVGLCGSGSAMSECFSTGRVEGVELVGGLVGENQNTLNAVYANGNVVGSLIVGGLVGLCTSESDVIASYCTGSVSGRQSAGGLVGENQGKITECYAENPVTGDEAVGGLAGTATADSVISACRRSCGTTAGNTAVGGLIGLNAGTLSRCHVNLSVHGTLGVGGLIGINDATSTVSMCCCNQASVQGATRAGGLVGEHRGSLQDCYAHGIVNGDEAVGGIAGIAHEGGKITHCYSTCAVHAPHNAGGLIGMAGNGIGEITHCFWDVQMSRVKHSAEGSGKSTAKLFQKGTFTGWFCDWDFDKIWDIRENECYPYLRGIPHRLPSTFEFPQ